MYITQDILHREHSTLLCAQISYTLVSYEVFPVTQDVMILL